MSKALGKRLHGIERSLLDQNKINRLRRRLEDIKLKVLDAIEAGVVPPHIHDVDDLYDIYTGYSTDRGYHFVWQEFSKWLSMNGLDSSWTTQRIQTFQDMGNDQYYKSVRYLRIFSNPYMDFEEIDEEPFKSLKELLNKKD